MLHSFTIEVVTDRAEMCARHNELIDALERRGL